MLDLDAKFDARLDLFLDHVTAPLENATQRAVFAEYAVGLLSDAERKSMEPLTALARPDDLGAAHKAFVYTGTARWEDLAVRRHAVAWALWGMTADGVAGDRVARRRSGPEHLYLCHLLATMSQRAMVGALNERWRIERIHEYLKGEVGCDHFEGRSWPG